MHLGFGRTGPGSMHLGLGRTRFNAFRFWPDRTRFNAFRFGLDPVRPINNGADLHCSREQWRHGEVQKEKGKGRRPWAVVRELRSTVLQREQWSLHCSRCRTVETWCRRRRRRRRGRAGYSSAARRAIVIVL